MSDVSEQLFNEKQLYIGDVVCEDGDGAEIGAFHGVPGSEGAEGVLQPPAVSAKPNGGPRERRRRKAATRATQIVFWLDTKYDILTEVCSSFERWRAAPSASYDFDLLWCDTSIPADRFMKLRPYQKMNHFVGMSAITRKNNLGRNLLRMRKQFPKEYRFFPDTWILPTDLSDFRLQFNGARNKTFIVKPDNGCQGKGIFLIRDVEKVPVDFSTTYVAQRYLHRPFLLDGYKFDLRLYVLVIGCDPLRIFLHQRGLVRMASEPYLEPNGKNLAQPMVHLTNYAINKLNPNYEQNTNPEDAQDGHKRSWEAVQEHLRLEGHDIDALKADIEDLIIKTLLAVQPNLSHFYHSCQPDDAENAMCFEILGFDIILDQRLQPWLLEVNHAPSFSVESELDAIVKREVLTDTFKLLNLSPETRRQKKREAREKMEQRALGVAKKQTLEDRMAQELEIALQRTAWEDAHLNGYRRLYPSEEKERKYLQIHDAAIGIWEMLMGGTSRRSVRLSDKLPPEEEGRPEAEVERKVRKGSAALHEARPSGSDSRRTAEEIREVVERLVAGNCSRPRNGGRRRSTSRGVAGKETEDSPELGDAAAGDAALPGKDGDAPAAPSSSAPVLSGTSTSPAAWFRPYTVRMEVQVGDAVKVQTNLGWESVTVRAKRSNGRIDIQFKDGEYMRAVLPRILRDCSGTAPCLGIDSESAEAAAASTATASRPSGTASGGGAAAAQSIGSHVPLLPSASERGPTTAESTQPTAAADGRQSELASGGQRAVPVAPDLQSGLSVDEASGLALHGNRRRGRMYQLADGSQPNGSGTTGLRGQGPRLPLSAVGSSGTKTTPAQARLRQQLHQLISVRPIGTRQTLGEATET
eukprot:CAMPEP_0170584158 /NCGR_PEP_ID=MMETSP0224-20130122/8539_1 /TAXON_ID=285029 /ORGANISM="Togula jolla, Strain CCCM 725" /LENGTH=864 /DNA_ID=CAMNT_0010907573 /DNA_START=103 /DNA_END=2693 /DNA_ORIENTATION=-